MNMSMLILYLKKEKNVKICLIFLYELVFHCIEVQIDKFVIVYMKNLNGFYLPWQKVKSIINLIIRCAPPLTLLFGKIRK